MKQLHFRYEMQLELDQEVWDHHFLIRCRPMENERQRCGNYSLRIDPADTIDEVCDGFGNRGYAGVIKAPHRKLHVTAEGIVLMSGKADRELPHPMYRFPSVHTMPEENIRRFLADSEAEYGASIHDMDGYRFLMNRLHRRFVYVPGVTTVKTTASEALAGGQGVCQDYAHIFISLCRLGGIPARYVAGMMSGEGATHAWAELWQDGAWVGMDPTNDRMVDESYIKLTHGRDFEDGTIDRGCFLGFARQSQKIHVKVEETT